MENTVKVLFEGDNTPQWYIAQGDRWVGPLTASDIYEKVLAQEITWAHYVWKPGQAEWQRICDIKTFQAAVPVPPAKNVVDEIERSRPDIKKAEPSRVAQAGANAAKATQAVPEKSWFLYYNDSQFGPFAFEEVSRFVSIGKINGQVFGWKNGMSEWQKLEEMKEFASLFVKSAGVPPPSPAVAPKKAAAPAEKRGTPRRPLIAKILVANDQTVHVGVCRDISVGGMQVLTDKIPGVAGEKIRMNVSPAGGSKADQVEPFVAEGVIVRILEDGLGFSFRFNKLDDNAKRAIEKHLSIPAESASS